MPKDRLLELKPQVHIEIRSGLGNGNLPGIQSSTQEGGKTKKQKSSKKMKKCQKTMDEIFKEIQQIRVWLEAVEEETKLVKRLHTVMQHSSRIEPEIKDKLMNAMIKIKTISLRTRSSLKTLERHKEEPLSSAEVRIVSTQHSALTKRFQTAMADYQAELVHHRDQTQALIKRELRIANGSTLVHSPAEIERLLDNEQTQVFVDNYVQETKEMKLALQHARVRHKEMAELENSIRELNELFTDLATIVQVQGDKINIIEFNVENGTNNVNHGNHEMSEAYNKKKSARRKKIWCLTLAACVLGLILAFVALHSLISSIFTF